jgi:hypothetical protein
MEKELETLEFSTSGLAMLISMEKQNLVGGLLKFGTKEVMSEVCEACQLGKQARHPFPTQTTHVSSKPLEMITQMCGPQRHNPLEDASNT